MATNKNFIVKNGLDVSGTANLSTLNLSGSLTGPATFTIDPAAIGDNTGTVVIAGNLQVDGTQTTINSTTMTVDDLNITLASGAANAAAADGAGLTVDGSSATLLYTASGDKWSFNKNVNFAGNIIGNDIKAAGSGGLSLQTDEGTKRIFIADSGDVKVGQLAVGSATTAPLHVAKAGTDCQAIFGDNNSSIDDPSIRIIGRNTANNAIRYTFLGLDADTNYGYLGYNAGAGGFVNALSFDTSGNVGIGTASPGTPLTISNLDNGTSFSSNRVLQLIGTSTTDGSRVSLAFTGNTNVGNGLAIIEAVNDDQSLGHTSLHMHTYDGSWNTENLVLKGGNVGINESSPSHRLHINGGSNDQARVRVTNTASGQASLDLDNSEGYFRTYTDAGEYRIYDQTDGTHRLVIDTSGNATFSGKITSTELTITGGSDGADLYINNTSPTLAFTDSNSYSDSSDMYIIRGGGSGDLQFQFFDNSANTTTTTFTIDETGNTTFAGVVGTDTVSSTGNFTLDVAGHITLDAGTGGTGIQLKDDGAQYGTLKGNSGAPTRLEIDSASVAGYLSVAGTQYFAWNTTDIRPIGNNTLDLGASGAVFRNLRLGSDAFIGGAAYLGGASSDWIDANDELVVSGRGCFRGYGHSALAIGRYNSAASAGEAGSLLDFLYGGSGVGTISITTNSTQYNTTSDVRLKDNIKPIVDGSSKIMAMNPVSHTWKANPTEDAVHGFIAQEMKDIVPESVTGEPEGEEMMQMDYGRITPVIVAGLQDALKEIEELKNRIKVLENR